MHVLMQCIIENRNASVLLTYFCGALWPEAEQVHPPPGYGC